MFQPPVECAPIFCVRNLEKAVGLYRALGFKISWDPGDENVNGHAFARYGGAVLQIAGNPQLVLEENNRSAFLVIGDPDALAEQWKALGHRVSDPWDGFIGYWGLFVDPDYNSLFFGRPAVTPGQEG